MTSNAPTDRLTPGTIVATRPGARPGQVRRARNRANVDWRTVAPGMESASHLRRVTFTDGTHAVALSDAVWLVLS